MEEAYKCFEYIFATDFNIEKTEIYKKLEFAAKMTLNILNLENDISEETKQKIKAKFLTFSVDVEDISKENTNGERRDKFQKRALRFVDEIVNIVK